MKLNFKQLIRNKKLIKKLNSLEQIDLLIQEGQKKIAPTQSILSLLTSRKLEINKQKIEENRKIEYFPLLESWIGQHGLDKDTLILLDEYLYSIKAGDYELETYVSEYKVWSLLNNALAKKTGRVISPTDVDELDLLDTQTVFIIDQLIKNSVISDLYELSCDKCGELLIRLDKKPNTEEEIENFKKKMYEIGICDGCYAPIDTPELIEFYLSNMTPSNYFYCFVE